MPRTKEAKNVSPKVVEAIKAVRLLYPEYTARQIIKEMRNNSNVYHLTGVILPGVRTVYSILEKNKPEIEKRSNEIKHSDLDNPWTIGVCSRYNAYFPPESIPKMMEYYKLQIGWDLMYKMTIREAIWIVRLRPVLLKVFSHLPDERLAEIGIYSDLQKDGIIILIAQQYARAERIAEVLGQQLNTAEIDEQYFVKEDISPFSALDGYLGGLGLYIEEKRLEDWNLSPDKIKNIKIHPKDKKQKDGETK